MSRIAKAFSSKAKIAYLTAGDGQNSLDYFLALERSGVNLLEVGIPFSDPVADGPTIQLAMERALRSGTNLSDVLQLVTAIRNKSEIAIVLFTYYNLIHTRLEGFLLEASKAGVDGILVVDLPLEESSEFLFLCNKYKLSPIMVAAPSTPITRIKQLTDNGDGFLYYACFKGTTGTRDALPSDLVSRMDEIKKHSKLPIAVGFGVSNKSMVKQILDIADGCVIGSYFVKALENNVSIKEFEALVREVFDVN